MLLKEEQFMKALSPIDIKLGGRSVRRSPEQLWNASVPMIKESGSSFWFMSLAEFMKFIGMNFG
jgi:hypothetical protein